MTEITLKMRCGHNEKRECIDQRDAEMMARVAEAHDCNDCFTGHLVGAAVVKLTEATNG